MQQQINGWTVKLHERDRYNDYSVVVDYSIEVCQPGDRYGRQFLAGTHRGDAVQLYHGAIAIVRKLAA